jgi:hypothetical protein
MLDVLVLPGGNGKVFWSYLPVHAGLSFPFIDRLTATAYGTLNWLGIAGESYEPFVNTGPTYHKDEAGNELTSYNYSGVFIVPGIKTGVLFKTADDFELELSYKGYWFKDRYLNSLGVGIVAPI